jgi:hypothetical protein
MGFFGINVTIMIIPFVLFIPFIQKLNSTNQIIMLTDTKDMFKKAHKGGYAVGAFNVNNMELIQGIMAGVAEKRSPVILQISRGAREYANPIYLRKLIEAAVEEYPDIPVVILWSSANNVWMMVSLPL